MAAFECRPEILTGVVQSLLELKKMARSIEQSADALIPLANAEASAQLQGVVANANRIAETTGKLYHATAKEALS